MSESNENVTELDRIRGWREKYRLGLSPSPLEDVTQLSAQLDMTHAHPSGIAQLFASGHVQLNSLFRDNGMLRAAGRRVERVLDDREAKSRVSGVGGVFGSRRGHLEGQSDAGAHVPGRSAQRRP